MKKLMMTATSVLVVGSLYADGHKMPTLYGLISKEIRLTKQEDKANASSFSGVTDVDGFETRLGAKGGLGKTKVGEVSYQIEMGVNSSGDTSAANDRIRIRLAQIDLKNTWGDLTAGQAWLPGTKALLASDPLTGTGAQALGLETGDLAGNVGGAFGSRANYFKDLITYTTPVFSGAQVSLSHWKSTGGVATNPNDDKWYEAHLNYKRKMAGVDFGFFGTFAKQESDSSSAPLETFWNLGINAKKDKFIASIVFGKDDMGKYNSKDFDYTNILVGFSYAMNKTCSIVANFGSTDFGSEGEGNTTSGVAGLDGKQRQIAVGMKSMINKHVSHRVIYKNVNRESKDGLSVNGTVDTTFTKNTANVILYGMTLKF